MDDYGVNQELPTIRDSGPFSRHCDVGGVDLGSPEAKARGQRPDHAIPSVVNAKISCACWGQAGG